jgi:hypothetical protein
VVFAESKNEVTVLPAEDATAEIANRYSFDLVVYDFNQVTELVVVVVVSKRNLNKKG